MLRLFFAAVLAACVAMPAGATAWIDWTMSMQIREIWQERPDQPERIDEYDSVLRMWTHSSGEIYSAAADIINGIPMTYVVNGRTAEFTGIFGDYYINLTFADPLYPDLSNAETFVSGTFHIPPWYGYPRLSWRGTITSFSARADSPGVPEPASWALLIAGFALAGGALRLTKSHDGPSSSGPARALR